LEFNGIKHVLHTIPSGIFHEGVDNLIGNGVVIDPLVFAAELVKLASVDPNAFPRLLLSRWMLPRNRPKALKKSAAR
jgi:adenylosuccinate synthase